MTDDLFNYSNQLFSNIFFVDIYGVDLALNAAHDTFIQIKTKQTKRNPYYLLAVKSFTAMTVSATLSQQCRVSTSVGRSIQIFTELKAQIPQQNNILLKVKGLLT